MIDQVLNLPILYDSVVFVFLLSAKSLFLAWSGIF